MRTIAPMSEVGAYEHFQRGSELLASRDFHQAALALEMAKRIEPDKASSREALGRAYLSVREYAKAAEEFEVVVEELRAFLTPVIAAARSGNPARLRWDAAGSWTAV